MSTPYTLNQYPLWKYLLIGLVMLWGLIFALPNLFGEDPAVQISGARANIAVDSHLAESGCRSARRRKAAAASDWNWKRVAC
jgi:preprotein translocase subunit SecD